MDRVRLRARLRRAAAPRRPLRRPARPPASAAGRSGGLHARVDLRGPGQRRHAARGHPLPQGRGRRLHRAGQPVDHHHDLRRGSRAQPRAQHLHRRRRQRVLARARLRRPDDRAGLALDLPAAGAGGARAADRGPAGAGQGRADRAGRAAQLRLRRRGDAHGGHAAAGAHDRRGARHGLERPHDARRAGRGRGAADDLRRDRAPLRQPARPARDPALRVRWCGPTSA